MPGLRSRAAVEPRENFTGLLAHDGHDLLLHVVVLHQVHIDILRRERITDLDVRRVDAEVAARARLKHRVLLHFFRTERVAVDIFVSQAVYPVVLLRLML